MRNKSKEQYENEINDLFSQYTDISGDGMDALRKTLLYRLINTAAEYIFNYSPIKNKENYGEEIFITIKDCIGLFDSDKGSNFVHYLNASVKNNLTKSSVRHHEFDKYRGLGISSKTIRKIKKVLEQKQLFTESGRNAGHEEMLRWIGKNLGLSPRLIKTYLNKAALLNRAVSYTSAQDELYVSGATPEEMAIRAENLRETLNAFDAVFVRTQERVKPYLRLLISAKYFELFEAADAQHQLPRQYSFFDYEAIEKWRTGDIVPTQRDIANEWDRTEQDASRTLGKFEKKVQEKLKKW
jgi:hypothetical protein